jgi:hypothetical protein
VLQNPVLAWCGGEISTSFEATEVFCADRYKITHKTLCFSYTGGSKVNLNNVPIRRGKSGHRQTYNGENRGMPLVFGDQLKLEETRKKGPSTRLFGESIALLTP